MRFICDEKEGWTTVVGKRSQHKVSARLLKWRAPPHIRESLPFSDSSAGETSDLDCTFLLVLMMFSTHLTVENQASELFLRVLPVGPHFIMN